MIDRPQRRRPSLYPAALFSATIVVLSGCGTVSHGVLDQAQEARSPELRESVWPQRSPEEQAVSAAANAIPMTPRAAAESSEILLCHDPVSAEDPLVEVIEETVPARAVEGPEAPPADGDRSGDFTVAVMTTSPHPSALALQTVPLDFDDEDVEPYDPWVSFNEVMFEFNRRVDRYVLKPVATVYDRVVPDRVQTMIASGFDNINSIPRMVNSLLQGKWNGALREFGRLTINSTIGIGGLFDMAQQEWGIRKSQEDFGQTLGVWGVEPGPYLVLPLMEPMTVRDGVGRAVDGFLDPLNYVMPFFWERLAVRVGDAVNERSLHLELFQGFEETVIDMYSAVRHVYLQRRERMVRE